jgi:glycine cleavage system H protein
MSPEDLLYTKEHEWIRVEGAVGIVGITDHAQRQLGDVVYVELPKVGDRFDTGQTFGSVESVKGRFRTLPAPRWGDHRYQ